MKQMNFRKYKPYPTLDMPDRQWPSRVITEAPEWVSVDLRDGNQALEIPMNLEQKIDFFDYLVKIGFKTIEIGFPAASDTEFDFCRHLIDNDLIPDDVAIQVLTQSRQHIIEKTFEAVKGAPKAVIHLYNSTSEVQRDVVFCMTKDECLELAVEGAKMLKEFADADDSGTQYQFEYSPESYTGTENDFAVHICDAVCDVWQPTPENKAIMNLPSTVEMSTPNVYADRIEYFSRHTRYRDSILISLHTHNDRGTGVASSELGILAGADRVEGTLFGNGERTGNADILTLALNLFSQGIDPKLDFTDINETIEVYERNTRMEVSPRHPYAGTLVYTAFSGSHQDAISKGMNVQQSKQYWDVPYLPIDPADVGRSYDPIIRINSQSGKGGIGYVLEQNYGLQVPKRIMQIFSREVTKLSDERHEELTPDEIRDLFDKQYINVFQPLRLAHYKEEMIDNDHVMLEATIEKDGAEIVSKGEGNGIVAAFCDILEKQLSATIEIVSYHQHALNEGTLSKAISYVLIRDENGAEFIGVGISGNISKSSLRAVASAVNNKVNFAAVK